MEVNKEQKFDSILDNEKLIDKIQSLRQKIIDDRKDAVTKPDKLELNEHQLQIMSDKIKNGKKNLNMIEFNKFFVDKNFKQWRLGNCYFVATLRSLMENGSYSKLIMNSVKTIKSDWNINRFIVKMPLWEPNGEEILVESDDINQKQYIIKNWKKIEKSWISDWPLWVKVLEAAYNEYVLWKDNWNLSSMEWWLWSLAILNLLWRENVKMFNYKIPKYNKTVYNNQNTSKAAFRVNKPNFENIELNEVKNFLLSFTPNAKIVTLNSRVGSTDTKTYDVWWKDFYYKHAYSLLWVKKNGNNIQSIDVVNPHDTSKTMSLSYDEFLSAFSAISGGILTKSFMDNKTNSGTVTVFDTKPRR